MKPKSPGTAKSRVAAPAAAEVGSMDLGAKVRQLRHAANMTLSDLASRTKLARSTLSKVENNQASPTFDVLQKIASGLGLDVSTLVRSAPVASALGRRSVTRSGAGERVEMPNYQHEFLCTEVANRRFTTIRTRVTARSRDSFPEWIRHPGEEFLLVLEGEIEFHSEHYAMTRLKAGDSVVYDSTMGHALVSISARDALVLWVTSTD